MRVPLANGHIIVMCGARRLGGIPLLEHTEGGEWVEVPREKLFADPALMTRAVRHATDSLPELVQQGLHP